MNTLGMVDGADDRLVSIVGEPHGMAEVSAIVTRIKEERQIGNTVTLSRRTNQSVDRLLNRHEENFQRNRNDVLKK
jgi:hypothetical protein